MVTRFPVRKMIYTDGGARRHIEVLVNKRRLCSSFKIISFFCSYSILICPSIIRYIKPYKATCPEKISLSLSLHRHPVGSAKAEGEQLGLPNGSWKNMPAIIYVHHIVFFRRRNSAEWMKSMVNPCQSRFVARNRSPTPKNGWFFTNTGHKKKKKTDIKHGLRWLAENSPCSSMFFSI